MKILWSPLALKRIEEIAGGIALDKRIAAEKWVVELFSQVERLKKFPKIGRQVPEVDRPSIREIVFGNYRIIYRNDPKQVSILTIRHSKQRLPLGEIVRAQGIRIPDDPMRGAIS